MGKERKEWGGKGEYALLALVGTDANVTGNVAIDHPKSWHQHLGYVLWALIECPNESINIAPWTLAFGRLPRGPLAVLKENWTGQRELY